MLSINVDLLNMNANGGFRLMWTDVERQIPSTTLSEEITPIDPNCGLVSLECCSFPCDWQVQTLTKSLMENHPAGGYCKFTDKFLKHQTLNIKKRLNHLVNARVYSEHAG